MDVAETAGLESELIDLPVEFDDCFGRNKPREDLRTYVSGQLPGVQPQSAPHMPGTQHSSDSAGKPPE